MTSELPEDKRLDHVNNIIHFFKKITDEGKNQKVKINEYNLNIFII